MWDAFPDDVRDTILRTGIWHRPSAYSEEPYPVTRALIEEGRRHLLLGGRIETGCPVHILQGMKDPDVPWEHAMRLAEHLPGDDVKITTIPDGDHRLSRPGDLDRLIRAVESAVQAVS
jgi:pimeloyl-ACP methyl ester carboxylesterase